MMGLNSCDFVVDVHFLLFSHFRNSRNCHRNGTTDKSCTLSSSYEWQNIHVDVRKNENLKMYIAFTKYNRFKDMLYAECLGVWDIVYAKTVKFEKLVMQNG